MAKYEKIKEPTWVTSVDIRQSRYGGDIVEIDMKGIKSQREYKTYCDPKNVNWVYWEQVIDVANRKAVVLGNLKFKDTEKGIVNADSKPTVEWAGPHDELREELEEYWRSQDRFNSLFGDSNE